MFKLRLVLVNNKDILFSYHTKLEDKAEHPKKHTPLPNNHFYQMNETWYAG